MWNERQQDTETMGNKKTQEILIMEAAVTSLGVPAPNQKFPSQAIAPSPAWQRQP